MTQALLCIEITLAEVDREFEDAVEGVIWALGAEGVERHDDQTFSQLVEDPRPRPRGSVRWRVFMEVPADIETAVSPYRDALGEVAAVDSWVLDDLSFLTAWREFFRPARVSPRIVVHPPWDRPDVEPGTVRVEIEPGMAFGTGTHETTRLCLAALDRRITRPGMSVFDVGCGSGVLAIAASLLGAARVEATDNDPEAVRVANENFAINQVPIVADDAPLTPPRGRFDVVVANILPHVLVALRDVLLAHVAPGGVVVLSGIVDDKRAGVVEAYERAGARVERQDRDGEWWSLEVLPS